LDKGKVVPAIASSLFSLRRGPAAFLLPNEARLMPKNAKSFQLVPVMALAMAESDL
jgi:hypothetical protein